MSEAAVHSPSTVPAAAASFVRLAEEHAWVTVPETKVFYPTEAEFADALGYIESISAEGRRYGVVRVVPPPSWRPAFAVDPTRPFATRGQPLDRLQTRNGPAARFEAALTRFLVGRGLSTDHVPPQVEARPLDLRALYLAVSARGGYRAVTEARAWPIVCAELAFAAPRVDTAAAVQQWYRVLLLDWELVHAHIASEHPALLTLLRTTPAALRTAERQAAERPLVAAATSAAPRAAEQRDEPHAGGLTSASGVDIKREETGDAGAGATEANARAQAATRSVVSKRSRAECDGGGADCAPEAKALPHESGDASNASEWSGCDAKRMRLLDGSGALPTLVSALVDGSPTAAWVAAPLVDALPTDDPVASLSVRAPQDEVVPVPTFLGALATSRDGAEPMEGARDAASADTPARLSAVSGRITTAADVAPPTVACSGGACESSRVSAVDLRASEPECLAGAEREPAPRENGPAGHDLAQQWASALGLVGDALAADSLADAGREHDVVAKQTEQPAAAASALPTEHAPIASAPRVVIPLPADLPEREFELPATIARDGRDEARAFAFTRGGEYSLAEFRARAREWTRRVLGEWAMDVQSADAVRRLEATYWAIVESGSAALTVEYGADLDIRLFGSGFPAPGEPGAESDWSLLRLPLLPNSLLSLLPEPILGVTVPWLYAGHPLSTFCWHIEDNYMPSINYVHVGSPKVWYGVPVDAASQFEAVWRASVGSAMTRATMHHLTSLVSPRVLLEAGVPVYRTTQRAGEFVVTFARGYHAGFNAGFNCAEAANFALADWITDGLDASREYKPIARPATFSVEALLVRIALSDRTLTRKWASSLLPAWRTVVAAELAARAAVVRASAVQFVLDPAMGNLLAAGELRACVAARGDESGLTAPLDFVDLSDADPSCVHCRCYTPFSGVRCMCAPTRLVCLEHADRLCGCPPERQEYFATYSESELGEITRRFEAAA